MKIRPVSKTPSDKCIQRLFQIRDQILLVLDSDGKADGIRIDSRAFQHLLRLAEMRGCCRMRNQGLGIANVDHEAEQMHLLKQRGSIRLAPIDPELHPSGKYFCASA